MVSNFRWEYTVFQFGIHSNDNRELEKLLGNGWRFVAATGTTILLKRDAIARRENDDLERGNTNERSIKLG